MRIRGAVPGSGIWAKLIRWGGSWGGRWVLGAMLFVGISQGWADSGGVAYSLEWLADSAATIGVYQVARVEDRPNGFHHLGLQRTGEVKGLAPEWEQKDYWVARARNAPGGIPELRPEVKVGDRFLVFHQRDARGVLQVVSVMNLSARQVSEPWNTPVNARQEVLAGDEILQTVRERLLSHPGAQPLRFGELAQSGSQFDVAVSRGFAARPWLFEGDYYLLVPDDLKPNDLGKGKAMERKRVEELQGRAEVLKGQGKP